MGIAGGGASGDEIAAAIRHLSDRNHEANRPGIYEFRECPKIYDHSRRSFTARQSGRMLVSSL